MLLRFASHCLRPGGQAGQSGTADLAPWRQRPAANSLGWAGTVWACFQAEGSGKPRVLQVDLRTPSGP